MYFILAKYGRTTIPAKGPTVDSIILGRVTKQTQRSESDRREAIYKMSPKHMPVTAIFGSDVERDQLIAVVFL
jgi:hypothetical protein